MSSTLRVILLVAFAVLAGCGDAAEPLEETAGDQLCECSYRDTVRTTFTPCSTPGFMTCLVHDRFDPETQRHADALIGGCVVRQAGPYCGMVCVESCPAW